ncbi:MAG: CBS domain-containing protein [Actinomycetota bacterium]|nr:CBS domain-containing protein [Actinomycetota bacterium]
MSVKEIMTKDVVTVPLATPVREVADLLSERNVSGVPVVDDEGRVLGVVSELDVVSRRGATAADIMSKQVISVTEDTDVDEVLHLFLNQRIRRVPVLSDGQHLAGIVSRSDLVRPASISHFLDEQNLFDPAEDPC